jgi:hypothetical protein
MLQEPGHREADQAAAPIQGDSNADMRLREFAAGIRQDAQPAFYAALQMNVRVVVAIAVAGSNYDRLTMGAPTTS